MSECTLKITDADFYNMLSLAENYFDTNEFESYEYHQCLILKTNQGERIYSFNCNSVNDLIEQSCNAIINEKIGVVEKIVCMWSGEMLDVPSGRFMSTLCEIDPNNKNAEVLLKSSVKKISEIINV